MYFHELCYSLVAFSTLFRSTTADLGARDNVFNKRASGSAAATSLSVVTTTVSGKTIEATFALTTLSGYASISQPVTTTLALNKPASQSSIPTDAAAVVIIGVGGVAYVLVGIAGEAGGILIEGPKPPTDGAPPEDTRCPVVKVKCGDCGGVNGICVSGTNTGCSCDQTEVCPTGNQQPKCEDTTCKGEGNKCTVDHKGCDCTPTPAPECPPEDFDLFCEECGGHNANVCKGVAEEKDKWKNCKCFTLTSGIDLADLEAVGTALPYWPDVDAAERQKVIAWVAGNEKMTLEDQLETPPVWEATCQFQDPMYADLGAPQRLEDADMTSAQPNPPVSKSADEFCDKFSGVELKVASEGVDTQFTMTKKVIGSFFISANIVEHPPKGMTCGKTAKINKIDCKNALWAGMLRCDPNSGTTHGFQQLSNCVSYNVTVTASSDPNFPPWRPKEETQYKCSVDQASGVASNYFKDMYTQFCTAVGSAKDKPLQKLLTNKDWKSTVSKRWWDIHYPLVRRTPPTNANMYDGYTFDFEWTGTKSGGPQCISECNDAFRAISQQQFCGTLGGQQNEVARYGQANVKCGTYNYRLTKPTERVTCKAPDLEIKGKPDCPPIKDPTDPKRDMVFEDKSCEKIIDPVGTKKIAYKAAIKHFCTDQRLHNSNKNIAKPGWNWSRWEAAYMDSKKIDPATFEWTRDSKMTNDSLVYFRVNANADANEQCQENGVYDMPSPETCERYLNAIVDKCTFDDIKDPKKDSIGGYYQDWTFKSGCYSWYLWGANATASFTATKPCKHTPGSIEATFGCEVGLISQHAEVESI